MRRLLTGERRRRLVLVLYVGHQVGTANKVCLVSGWFVLLRLCARKLSNGVQMCLQASWNRVDSTQGSFIPGIHHQVQPCQTA